MLFVLHTIHYYLYVCRDVMLIALCSTHKTAFWIEMKSCMCFNSWSLVFLISFSQWHCSGSALPSISAAQYTIFVIKPWYTIKTPSHFPKLPYHCAALRCQHQTQKLLFTCCWSFKTMLLNRLSFGRCVN